MRWDKQGTTNMGGYLIGCPSGRHMNDGRCDCRAPRVGSVCSGAGGMDLGFERAGFETRWVCEFDPFRRQLLAKHFPAARQYHDLSELDPAVLEPVDVLIGGTPCQDLSVAGNRAGLDGERSGLFWDYMRVRNELNIPWAVWENVAGALSSNNGLDFASVLGAFVGADVDVPSGGWGGAGVVTGPWGGAVWRLLDAQHFGVPQRRRRVFVVGRLGGPCPPEVLFESAGGAGDFEARGGAGASVADESSEGTTGTLRSHCRPASNSLAGVVVSALDTQRGGPDDNSAQAGHLVAGRGDLRGEPAGRSPRERNGGEFEDGRRETGAGVSGGTDRFDGAPVDADRMRAPDELAGFLDGAVSAVDPQPDGRRYAACGDGVVASVAEWIGVRLRKALDG